MSKNELSYLTIFFFERSIVSMKAALPHIFNPYSEKPDMCLVILVASIFYFLSLKYMIFLFIENEI